MASSDSRVVPGLPFNFKKCQISLILAWSFYWDLFLKKYLFSTILVKSQQNIQHYMKFQNLFDIFWQIISESLFIIWAFFPFENFANGQI